MFRNLPYTVVLELRQRHVVSRAFYRSRTQIPAAVNSHADANRNDGAGLSTAALAPPVLNAHTRDVKNALHSVAYNPQPQGHIRILVATKKQDGGGRDNEREVPKNIQDYDGLRIGPIALSFFQLLRRRLPHHHRRLAHQSASARLPKEARRLA